MTKEIMYMYLGTNGTICSPVHLEDIYYVRKIKLIADVNKVLIKDGIEIGETALIAEDDLPNWSEQPRTK